jgi:hypothetical protein
MHRRTGYAAIAALATLIPVSAAQAGTVALDKPCYSPGQAMVATGTGFTPGVALPLAGDSVFPDAATDAAGNFQVPLAAPTTGTTGAKAADVVTRTLTVTDPANPALNAQTQYQLANFAVDRGASRNPRSVRTWYFSGFPKGEPIYGHFRFKGKTVANYRFGVAAGACGLLSKRARGIPVDTVRTGTYTLQIDTKKTYKAKRLPSLVGKITVYLVRG